MVYIGYYFTSGVFDTYCNEIRLEWVVCSCSGRVSGSLMTPLKYRHSVAPTAGESLVPTRGNPSHRLRGNP
ncbi:hypothetical protein AAMO2058_000751500 [Amorphochlora amoebiformis]